MYFQSFFLLLAISSCLALTCTEQWECQPVSDNYNFVSCTGGSCQCRTDLGFEGNATESNKCHCPFNVYWGLGNPYCKECNAPREIVYQNGLPFCVDGSECEENVAQKQRNEIRKQKIMELYLGLRPPTPLLVMTGIVDVHDIFATNVRGRVTPVGSFTDFEGVVEYFYGLAVPTPIIVLNFPTLVAEGNKVAVRVDLLFNATANQPLHNLTQTGSFTFNSDNKIVSFDLSILNLGAAIDQPEAARPFVIQQLCNTLVVNPGTCAPGTYVGSYSNFADCVAFMSSIPYGSWNRANSNTVVCRQLHTLLTPFRPAIHCPHAGKTGGGACIDFPYTDFYTNDFP